MDNYLVLGNPIKQSKSPFIHQAFALQTAQNISYQSQFAELDGFSKVVNDLISRGGKGANVTAPFKEQALALCDELTDRAKEAGAVNTLSFINNRIYGDNTDGLGLVQDLKRNKVNLSGARIILLGAGGAAKGVILPLLNENPLSLTIVNRTLSKAQALCEQFNNSSMKGYSFDSMPNMNADIIINATSASLSGKLPPLNSGTINTNTVCYDMVYSYQLTPFLQWSSELGARKTIDGLGMLVGQAAESFRIWRNVMPEVESVLTSLRKELAQSAENK